MNAVWATRGLDAIIVGAGAAGLGAATCAAAFGAHVLVLDRTDGSDSDFAKSGGRPAAAGTVWQEAAGIDDSPDRWTEDIRRKTNHQVEQSIVRLVTTRARDAMHFQAQRLGLDIRLFGSIPIAGHSASRLHGTPKGGGREYFELLAAAAGRMSGIVRMNDVEVTGLVIADGGVRGVRLRTDGQEHEIRAPLTLLACGGFAASRAMLLQYAPEIAAALYTGCPHNEGSGIRWAQNLGAATSYLDSYQGQGHVTADGKGSLGPGLTTLGAVLINRDGHRFVREDIGPSELAAHILAAPGATAVEVYDQNIHDVALSMEAYRDCVARDVAVSAPTAHDLAARFDLPPETLLATLDAANRAARGEGADPMNRTAFARPLSPPFWGVRVTGALVHTQGGLAVNANAQVLRTDGSQIDGLLAAGGTVTGISGSGAAGYSSGNGLAHAFGLGLIASETIVARMRQAEERRSHGRAQAPNADAESMISAARL